MADELALDYGTYVSGVLSAKNLSHSRIGKLDRFVQVTVGALPMVPPILWLSMSRRPFIRAFLLCFIATLF